jgi:AcrR family transcriptional regulator
MRNSTLTPKGAARRELLVNAALVLLDNFPLEKISLQQIADATNIPASSSYHFFANAHEVFSVLARRFGAKLIEAITAPYPPELTTSWQQLYGAAVDRGVNVYHKTPAYCKLILCPNTPPAIKLSDRKNDALLGAEFVNVLDRYFELYKPPGIEERIFYSIEIVDLFLCLSYTYNQKLETSMIEEAKGAAIAYLERYLPLVLPKRQNHLSV